jgi:pimeloyl-ACP methyl ester carboxylesterase
VEGEIRYAKSGDISVAYNSFGTGDIDLLVVPGFVSHVEASWENPDIARFYRRLASFARLTLFDKRGTGLSDRGVGHSTIEDYAGDAGALMEAAGSERAAIMGVSEGGSTALLFAATYPERTSALIIYGSYARLAFSEDYPIGFPVDRLLAGAEHVSEQWGTGMGLEGWAPSLADDERSRQWWAQFQRLAASPGDVKAIMSAYASIDIRRALPAISAPTLVIHKKGDRIVPVEMGRFLAKNIPGATYLELPGMDHLPWTEEPEAIIGEIEEFLTGVRHAPEATRKLATVVFTDIVGSTQLAASLGDRAWRDLLERHDGMIRRSLTRFTGREVKNTGDGFLAVFEGPTAAIRFGEAIRGGALALDCEVRMGIHTGEVEIIGEDIGGIAVHIARRVADMAGPGEIWVSGTVPGIVAGSGIQFREQGAKALRGVPGEWPLFAVSSA